VYPLWLIFAYAFFWGLRKGSMICATVCAPGLLPYIGEKRVGWKRGVWMGVVFNLPRMVLLTLLGAVLGYVAYTMGRTFLPEGIETQTSLVGAVGYLAVGVLLAGYGLVLFARAVDEREDLREYEKKQGSGEVFFPGAPVAQMSSHRVSSRRNLFPHVRFALWVAEKTGGKRNALFLTVWGAVLGLACVGETSLAVEAAVLSGGVGFFSSSAAGATFFGGLMMFIFSVGAAVPVIAVSGLGGAAGEYMRDAWKMNTFKIAASVAMMTIGGALVFLMLPRVALLV